MAKSDKTQRICDKGHVYYKSSSCPVCPVCEKKNNPGEGFLSSLSAPARRALENAGLTDPGKLSKKTQAEVLALHGMGPGSLPKLIAALKAAGLVFKK